MEEYLFHNNNKNLIFYWSVKKIFFNIILFFSLLLLSCFQPHLVLVISVSFAILRNTFLVVSQHADRYPGLFNWHIWDFSTCIQRLMLFCAKKVLFFCWCFKENHTQKTVMVWKRKSIFPWCKEIAGLKRSSMWHSSSPQSMTDMKLVNITQTWVA